MSHSPSADLGPIAFPVGPPKLYLDCASDLHKITGKESGQQVILIILTIFF
jgi:hypothetical protein